MGRESFKKNNDKIENNKKIKIDKNDTANKERMPDKQDQKKKNDQPEDEESKSKQEYASYVQSALKECKNYSLLKDIEDYISKKHRINVDAFNRRKIITQIVIDHIQKGCFLFRTIKGNCN